MSPHRIATAALICGLVLAGVVGTALVQQDHATPQEVVQKVRQAAQDLARSGEPCHVLRQERHLGLEGQLHLRDQLRGREAVDMAHPIKPELKGKPTAQSLAFGPKPGEQLAAEFCTEGQKQHGGWVEYGYRKAEETQPERKVAYLLAVSGTTYVVGAGIYDPTSKVDELNKLGGG